MHMHKLCSTEWRARHTLCACAHQTHNSRTSGSQSRAFGAEKEIKTFRTLSLETMEITPKNWIKRGVWQQNHAFHGKDIRSFYWCRHERISFVSSIISNALHLLYLSLHSLPPSTFPPVQINLIRIYRNILPISANPNGIMENGAAAAVHFTLARVVGEFYLARPRSQNVMCVDVGVFVHLFDVCARVCRTNG